MTEHQAKAIEKVKAAGDAVHEALGYMRKIGIATALDEKGLDEFLSHYYLKIRQLPPPYWERVEPQPPQVEAVHEPEPMPLEPVGTSPDAGPQPPEESHEHEADETTDVPHQD